MAALGIAALLAQNPAWAAHIRVMISAGLHGVYSELAPAFERASSHHPGFAFAGVLTKDAQRSEAASALLRFLASAEAAPVISKGGLMPIAGNWPARSI